MVAFFASRNVYFVVNNIKSTQNVFGKVNFDEIILTFVPLIHHKISNDVNRHIPIVQPLSF